MRAPYRNLHTYVLLVSLSILIRIPFLKAFDLVAYDGTYYINQARSILEGAHYTSTFPIGYPLIIALFLPLIRDGTRAAQVASFLAALCSLLVLYELGKHFIKRSHALLTCLILAVTPLFIRLSMMTISESAYVFWVLLGLLLFAKRRNLFSGISLGMAAITRPEALGICCVLAAMRLRRPRRLLVMLAGFAIVYSVNVIVHSSTAKQLVLVPKTQMFGSHAKSWKLREGWLEFRGKEASQNRLRASEKESGIFVDYLKRTPQELMLLIKHATPVVFALAIYAVCRQRLFLLASFVPFLFYPLFTFRSEPRFIYPYIPALILYALIGLESIRKRRTRIILSVLLSASAAWGLVFNRGELTQPVSVGFKWAKEIGSHFKNRIMPWEKVADRKPFFAFYADAEYVKIPVAPYDETLSYLAGNDIKYLVLHKATIHGLRPKLRPLLYDRAVINGELRYSQIFFQPDVVAIYRKNMDSDPIKRRRLLPLENALISGLSWSPNGENIAFRKVVSLSEGGIYIISPSGGQPQRIVSEKGIWDHIAWAPDSKRIAFANDSSGNMDIYIYQLSGELRQITSHPAKDMSPSWSSDGNEIAFSSDRSGQDEIWSKNLETGELTQITANERNTCPAISPDGNRIAWIRKGQGLVIYERDTGAVARAVAPKSVYFVPTWSPDGRFIAVTGEDWGKIDVYVLTADGMNAVLLTKSLRKECNPTWSPDGQAIAAVDMQENESGLVILTGIEPYLDRLTNPVRARTFQAFK